ncbi:MAG: UPF0104 family protein [Chloroflexi bacterium]|nr:lysylphosphatidylglycerol synthase transmembrane domain-containing protein [Chloroflexota bacterium]MQC26040.1 UPF0104 family protein [Chloroflexota bacterium]
MTKPGESSPRLFARMLPGILISALALVILFFFIDINQVAAAFSQANFSWVPVAALLFLGAVAIRAKAWRTLLEEQVSFKDSFLALNQGYLLNNVLPFRLGELGRALLLGQRSGLGFWRVFSTIVVERIFDVGFAAGLLLVSLPLFVDLSWIRSAAFFAGALVVMGFGLLFALAANPVAFLRLISALTRPWPRLQSWVGKKLAAFTEGLAALKSGLRFLTVSFWMALAWAFNLAWYFALMFAFFPEPQFIWTVVAVALGSLGVALPSSPGYIGVLEGAVVAGLSLFGIEPSLALAYAIAAHALYFVMTGVGGAIGFAGQGESLGHVYRQLLTRSSMTQGEG